MDNKIIIIVDGYSNGRFFAPGFKARGYSCVHVQSRTKIPEILMSTFRKDDYLEQFIHLGNIKETLSQLQKYDILCVIPGAETGVELADQLSEKMGLLSNGTDSSIINSISLFSRTVDSISAASSLLLRVTCSFFPLGISLLVGFFVFATGVFF